MFNEEDFGILNGMEFTVAFRLHMILGPQESGRGKTGNLVIVEGKGICQNECGQRFLFSDLGQTNNN